MIIIAVGSETAPPEVSRSGDGTPPLGPTGRCLGHLQRLTVCRYPIDLKIQNSPTGQAVKLCLVFLGSKGRLPDIQVSFIPFSIFFTASQLFSERCLENFIPRKTNYSLTAWLR